MECSGSQISVQGNCPTTLLGGAIEWFPHAWTSGKADAADCMIGYVTEAANRIGSWSAWHLKTTLLQI